MNSKLLRVITGTVISTMIIAGSLSTLYFMNSKPQAEIEDDTDIEDEIDTRTPEQIAAENVKAALGENLGCSNLEIKDLNLDVKGFGSNLKNAINLNFKGGIDYKAFMDSTKDNDPSNDIAAKLSGTCEFKYIEDYLDSSNPKLDEKFILNANGNGRLYIDWNWADNINNETENYTRYSVSGKIINDVLNFLPTIQTLTGMDLSSVDGIINEIKNVDIIPLIPIVTNALMSFSSDTDLNQTPEIINGEKIYTYNLIVKESMLSSVGINQDLKITLKCNEEGLLRNFILEEIKINDNLSISLNAITNMKLDEGFVNNDEYVGEANNLDCTTNLLTTVSSLINEKAFNSNISLKFNEFINGIDTNEKEITGKVKGDFRNAASINDGAIFDISLGGEKDLYTNVTVRYENNSTYFNVQNGLAKGYIENSTIDDLVKNIVGTVANDNQDTTNEAMDTLNNVLKDEILLDIINGNWNAYKKIIKNLVVEGDSTSEKQVLKLILSASSLYSKLPDVDFSINLDLSNGKLNSLAIEGLPINKYETTDGNTHLNKVSFTLGLTDFEETNINVIYGNLDEYTDFKIINPLYNSIAKIIKSKQIGLTYGFSYTKASENLPVIDLTGELNADLNEVGSLTFEENSSAEQMIDVIRGTNLGLYQIGLHGKVNDVPHNLNLVYQNQGLYLDYKGISETSRTRMSVTQGKICDIFTFVLGMVNDKNGDTTNNPLANINMDVESLLNLTDGKIWDILNSNYLDTLKQYISIKNGASKDTVEVTINNALFNAKSTGYIKVVLDTISAQNDNPSLLSISGEYLVNQNDDLFSFNLNFGDYNNPTISDEEIDNYYKKMDSSIDSIINIIKGVPTSFNIKGQLNNPRHRSI